MWPELEAGWSVVGIGDFNGDGFADLLLRNADGTVTDWLGIGDGSFTDNSGTSQIQVPTDWHVVGTGDFNGGGMSDVLWRNDIGTINDWLGQSNGGFVGNAAHLNITVPNDWQVEATGDFNGDGRTDVLWRNEFGTVGVWLGQSDGSLVGYAANVTIATDWQVAGTGDFNGDGRTDVLWRNEFGTIGEWLGQADGTFLGNAANVNVTVGNDSHVAGVGDFNGDGKADILWRASDGTITDWLGQANGGFVDNSAVASQPLDLSLKIDVQRRRQGRRADPVERRDAADLGRLLQWRDPVAGREAVVGCVRGHAGLDGRDAGGGDERGGAVGS